MIETDLALSRDDPAYNHDASWALWSRSEPTSSTIPIMTGPRSLPIRGWENLAHAL